jgi:hypothetical protein
MKNSLSSIVRHAVTYAVGIFVAFFVSFLTAPSEIEAAQTAGAAMVEPLTVFGGLAAALLTRLALPWVTKIFRRSAGEERDDDNGSSGGMTPLMVGLLGMAAVLGTALPSCSADQVAAVRAFPLRTCAETDYGTVCYSTADGVTVAVDARSGK